MSQVGTHVTPLAEGETQFPAPALAREGRLVQIALQVPVTVHDPELQTAVRSPAKPELQTGVHEVPLAEPARQFPFAALVITGKEEQAVLVQEPVVDQVPEVQAAVRVPEKPVLHVGTHEVPELEGAMQFPAPAFVIDGKVGQSVLEATHEPVSVHVPAVQEAFKVPVKPVLHTGTQEVPLSEGATQFPALALVMVGSEVQGLGVQDPVVVQLPELHVAVKVPVKPEMQVGTQELPLVEGTVQLPGPALVMEGAEVHPVGTAVQDPVVIQLPELQTAERVPVKPVSQVGVQVVPVVEGLVQFPGVEFAIGGDVVQSVLGATVQDPVVVQLPELQVAARVPL